MVDERSLVEQHELDLTSLRLGVGEARRFAFLVKIEPILLGGQSYAARPARVSVKLDVSRMSRGGYALRLRLKAALVGPCMRCLEDAAPGVTVEVREVEEPGEGEELSCPYVQEGALDLGAWTRDAFVLAAPAQVLCREDCAGLCPICAANLNEAESGHHHERPLDPRWEKLRELRLR